MRFVVYDDESFEPITVIKLPGFTERDILSHGRRWRVPVPEEFAVSWRLPDKIEGMAPMRIVDLFFEPFVRNTSQHGRQDRWICFTKATELAMLLNPDWLPGQRPAVEYLQTQNDRLTSMLIGALSR